MASRLSVMDGGFSIGQEVEMETSTILTILSIIGGLIVAIKGAFALFQFIVQNIITPLTLNISALQDTTRELKSLLERVRGDMQSLDKRLTIVEQSVKSAHKRLDHIFSICDQTHTTPRSDEE